MQSSQAKKLSMREPSGILFAHEDRIIRMVRSEAVPQFEKVLASPAIQGLTKSGNIPRTRVLTPSELDTFLKSSGHDFSHETNLSLGLEHSRVSFATYPYEWPVEMLYRAAIFTLELTQAMAKEGMTLKDASPYNVLFEGPRPVFVDLLSFERKRVGDPSWVPFGQFVRTFLNPLIAYKEFGLDPRAIFLPYRDGLESEQLYRMLNPFKRLFQPYFSTVTVPYWLGRRKKLVSAQRSPMANSAKADFIFDSLIKHLKRNVQTFSPEPRASRWGGYLEALPYTNQQFEGKEAFVRRMLSKLNPKLVLDVGCNTGHFSFMAASQGAKVVAIDNDANSVGQTFRAAEKNQLDVLPLQIDLVMPSAARGWGNKEYLSFLDRTEGKFDLVLFLAVLHHLTMGEQIPLPEVLNKVSQLLSPGGHVVLEFAGPQDPMVQDFIQSRQSLRQISKAQFEETASRFFSIEVSEVLPGMDRTIYLLKKI